MRRPRIGALVALSALWGLLAGCAASAGPSPGGSAAEPAVAIIGSWRATSIPGYTPPASYPDAFQDAPISFDVRHRMWGSDGCNGFEVSYRVGRDGSFSSGPGAMTAIGCANVPNDQVTAQARQVVIDNGELTFLDGDGRLLGRYQRIAAVGRPDVGPGPLATSLVGTWRPLRITGYRVTTGTYTLDPGGRISVTSGPTASIGCAAVPNAVVLSQAATVQVTGDRLTLRSAPGGVLATYQRVR